jgi:transposase-like protein
MAVRPSIDLSGWLSEQLAQASPDLLRGRVKTFAEALMSAEADAVCGAPYGVRSEERRTKRNGYREREWDTRAGTVELAIPRLREGSYFPDWLLERRRRAEQALVTVVATSYLLGVSTRRVEKLVETLGITRLSKSQVSEMAKSLDAQVEAFRTRPLDAGPYTFLAADALVLKVREGGRTVNVHALLATGVNADGYREILGLHVTSAEDGAGWLAFFRDLVARGLSGVALVTSDAHRGLVEAIGVTLPGASWQRCRTHYAANLMSVTPKAAWTWVKGGLHSVYDQPDADAVHAQFARLLDALSEKLPAVAAHLDQARADILAFTAFPESDLATDLEQQPARTAQPRDPPPHRRRRHLPRPGRTDPPRRRRARRTTRRMDRDAPLHRPRSPQTKPAHHHRRQGHQRGGVARRDHRITSNKGSRSAASDTKICEC